MSTKPEQVSHFYCGDCGPHVAADEDGLCGQCGGDTVVQACCSGHDEAASPPSAEELADRLILACRNSADPLFGDRMMTLVTLADREHVHECDIDEARRILADVLRGG